MTAFLVRLQKIYNLNTIFMYAIRVWAVASKSKYLSQIDRLQRRALRFGYIQYVDPIERVIREKDMKMWNDIINVPKHPLFNLLPPERNRRLRKRSHNFILPKIRTDRFKKCFINRCLLNL